jgi:hypothetical protein
MLVVTGAEMSACRDSSPLTEFLMWSDKDKK